MAGVECGTQVTWPAAARPRSRPGGMDGWTGLPLCKCFPPHPPLGLGLGLGPTLYCFCHSPSRPSGSGRAASVPGRSNVFGEALPFPRSGVAAATRAPTPAPTRAPAANDAATGRPAARAGARRFFLRQRVPRQGASASPPRRFVFSRPLLCICKSFLALQKDARPPRLSCRSDLTLQAARLRSGTGGGGGGSVAVPCRTTGENGSKSTGGRATLHALHARPVLGRGGGRRGVGRTRRRGHDKVQARRKNFPCRPAGRRGDCKSTVLLPRRGCGLRPSARPPGCSAAARGSRGAQRGSACGSIAAPRHRRLNDASARCNGRGRAACLRAPLHRPRPPSPTTPPTSLCECRGLALVAETWRVGARDSREGGTRGRPHVTTAAA